MTEGWGWGQVREAARQSSGFGKRLEETISPHGYQTKHICCPDLVQGLSVENGSKSRGREGDLFLTRLRWPQT